MAEYNKADRQVARAIVMAQIASDAGKGRIWRDPIPVKSSDVPKHGYGLKESMIMRALVMINTQKKSVWRYYVELAPDQNGFQSVLVYLRPKILQLESGCRYPSTILFGRVNIFRIGSERVERPAGISGSVALVKIAIELSQSSIWTSMSEDPLGYVHRQSLRCGKS